MVEGGAGFWRTRRMTEIYDLGDPAHPFLGDVYAQGFGQDIHSLPEGILEAQAGGDATETRREAPPPQPQPSRPPPIVVTGRDRAVPDGWGVHEDVSA